MWVGLQYTSVEREPSLLCNIVTSKKNGITYPCSLPKVNWMFWLMELVWASIPSTWSGGTAVRTSTYLFQNTGDILRTRSSMCSITMLATTTDTASLKIAGVLTSAKPPPSNLPWSLRKALDDLKKREDIVILPADKGHCMVVMDKTEYHAKVDSLLADRRSWIKIQHLALRER